jgi:hypothetical protein
MAADGQVGVYLPRGQWEAILAKLNAARDLTPASKRLAGAIDAALNADIDATLARIESIPEGE